MFWSSWQSGWANALRPRNGGFNPTCGQPFFVQEPAISELLDEQN